ncbi:S24 family peptidase [Asaia bogorensis]|uniref:S24 family peptidase n=1 Tax=Asaia bogorensis TaxID=91915 RepID=UPI003016A09C
METPDFHALSTDDEIKARAARLREAVQKAGGNSQVAMRAQMALGTLNNYIAGRDMKANAMVALASACSVSLDWLARGVGEMGTATVDMSQITPAKPKGYEIPLKFFEVEPSAGNGASPADWIASEECRVPQHFARSVFGAPSKSLFFVRVKGASMEPTLKSGSTILVDYAQQEFGPGIYMMSFNDSLFVKRLTIKDTETFKVVSDNPAYGCFEIPIHRVCWGNAVEDADLRILGRVIGRYDTSL